MGAYFRNIKVFKNLRIKGISLDLFVSREVKALKNYSYVV